MAKDRFTMPALVVGCFVAAVAAKNVCDYQDNRITGMRTHWAAATPEQKFKSIDERNTQLWCKDTATGVFNTKKPDSPEELTKMLKEDGCVPTADQGQVVLVVPTPANNL